jgi:hypothetical protein
MQFMTTIHRLLSHMPVSSVTVFTFPCPVAASNGRRPSLSLDSQTCLRPELSVSQNNGLHRRSCSGSQIHQPTPRILFPNCHAGDRVTPANTQLSPEDCLHNSSRRLWKSKLYYDRQSVGQSVLVSGIHLGPATNFSFSLNFFLHSCGFVIL